jgi:serine/threonine protein kinase
MTLLAQPLYQRIDILMTDVVTSQSTTPANLERNLFRRQTASDEDLDGEILAGRYSIQSLLGRGGFGVTFLARNIYLPGKPLCVIKQLAPGFTDPVLIAATHQQFDLEALSLSRLGSHAQVPCLLDYFKVGTDSYLVEEYIHSHHLIHRDIKPENIILCQIDRRFVLVDFGAVQDIDPATIGEQTTVSSTKAVGTPGFAPPEQLANRAVCASDLYALGMTCICLLTGKEPSQFPIDPLTCELIWSDMVEISKDLSETIGKMIQISLTERYQSATQVLTALENRSIRAKLRTYLDQKHAISRSEQIGDPISYPAVVHWALGIE